MVCTVVPLKTTGPAEAAASGFPEVLLLIKSPVRLIVPAGLATEKCTIF